MTKMRRTNKNN